MKNRYGQGHKEGTRSLKACNGIETGRKEILETTLQKKNKKQLYEFKLTTWKIRSKFEYYDNNDS